MSKRKKKKKSGSLLLTLGMLICLAVMAYSGYQLIRTAVAYQKGVNEYEGLRQYTSVKKETKSILVEKSAEEAPAVDPVESAPIDVDFASLKAINPDVVGWLYIGALDISYPIVHGSDNDYYLHHTFEGQENFAGSIFVEMANKGDFSDPNTIVYGHNMKNQSMFGKLHTLTAEGLYQQDSSFWILTPEGNYKYQMFSLHVVETSGETYTLFDGRDRTFVDWADKMQATNEAGGLEKQTFTEQSKVVSLSTCTVDSGTRYVVQGVRLK